VEFPVRHLAAVDQEAVDRGAAHRRLLGVVRVRPHPEPAGRDLRHLLHVGYWPAVSDASSLATAWSIVKLAAFCRGGNSLNVSRNWPTSDVAARTRMALSITQSQYVLEVTSARSNGSVRRLKSFGRRSATNGSAQICSVPCTRCSMN